jgi:hypothetical protein
MLAIDVNTAKVIAVTGYLALIVHGNHNLMTLAGLEIFYLKESSVAIQLVQAEKAHSVLLFSTLWHVPDLQLVSLAVLEEHLFVGPPRISLI